MIHHCMSGRKTHVTCWSPWDPLPVWLDIWSNHRLDLSKSKYSCESKASLRWPRKHHSFYPNPFVSGSQLWILSSCESKVSCLCVTPGRITALSFYPVVSRYVGSGPRAWARAPPNSAAPGARSAAEFGGVRAQALGPSPRIDSQLDKSCEL